jgi:hypothetical protein
MGLFSILAFNELNKTRWLDSILIVSLIFILIYAYCLMMDYVDYDFFDMYRLAQYLVSILFVRIVIQVLSSTPKVIPTIPYEQQPIDFIPIPPHYEPEPTPEPTLEEFITAVTTVKSSNSRIILYLIVILIIGASVYGVMKYYNLKHKKSKNRK